MKDKSKSTQGKKGMKKIGKVAAIIVAIIVIFYALVLITAWL